MYYLSWTPPRASCRRRPVRGIDRACDASVPEDGFTDVPPDNVHERAIDCAVHYDIASGRTAVTYAPADLVSREQLRGFLARTVTAAGRHAARADAQPLLRRRRLGARRRHRPARRGRPDQRSRGRARSTRAAR
jgi:hypothetical protein